jgi:hypothetical protein
VLPPVSPPPAPTALTAPWNLAAVDEGGSQRLQVVTPDGMRATCERLTLHVKGVPPVAVAIEGKQVQLSYGSAGGENFRASADYVTRNGPEGCQLVLTGNAHLTLTRQGKQRAEVTAELVVVNLLTGQVEASLGAATPPVTVPSPVNIQPCVTGCDSRTGSGAQPAQVFSFWQSYMR